MVMDAAQTAIINDIFGRERPLVER
jgi:hypothetical protein